MITRRSALVLAAALPCRAAFAEDWRSKYPEIRFAIIPAENEDGLSARWTPMIAHLSAELRAKVSLRIANDYAAVIEGQRAGHIELAYYGPAAFARALMIGVRTEAFAQNVNRVTGKGYYSVFYVLARSPFRNIEDLRGKTIGLVDPNSTSGYQVPLYTLNKLGIDGDKFFARSIITGSHENAVMALANGTVDVAANAWTSDTSSTLARMLTKKMVKNAKGELMQAGDFRIILTLPMIVNGPYAYLADLPEPMKADIRAAFFAAAAKAPAAFDKLSDGQNGPWEPVNNDTYGEVIKLIRFVDGLRKTRS